MMINNNSNWKQTLYCKRKNRAVNPFAISEKKKWFTLINKFIIQIYVYIIQNHSIRDVNGFNISKCHYFGYNFGYNSTYELSKKIKPKFVCLCVGTERALKSKWFVAFNNYIYLRLVFSLKHLHCHLFAFSHQTYTDIVYMVEIMHHTQWHRHANNTSCQGCKYNYTYANIPDNTCHVSLCILHCKS